MNAKKTRLWLIIGGAACAVAGVPVASMLVVMFVAQPVRFEGTSMLPSYHDGDRLLLQKAVVEVKRGDVICFHYPRDPSRSYVKRVVGLAGETIEVRDREVLINGVPLSEPYVSPEYNQLPRYFGPAVVPEGSVFVLGDNRDHSNDSRAWGPVPLSLVYGKVLLRYG
jgi:signal peptidase I